MKATAAFMTYGSYLVVVFSNIAEIQLLSLYLKCFLDSRFICSHVVAKLKFVLV